MLIKVCTILLCISSTFIPLLAAKLFGLSSTYRSMRPHHLAESSRKWLNIRSGEVNGAMAEEEQENADSDKPALNGDEDFATGLEVPVLNTARALWNKTPPMTQLYVGSSMLITVLSFILNQNKWPDILHFDWSKIATGQIWRIASAFMFFGQLDLFYPLTMQFVWQHMTQLERLNYNRPEDFFIMVLFGGSTLIALYTILGLSTRFLGHNLATYLVYIWSRVFEGTDVSFMDLFTLKAELLPWFFSAQTMLLEQEIPWADIVGIFVGHLYYYMKQKGALTAPDVVRGWFQSERMKARYAAFKSDFE